MIYTYIKKNPKHLEKMNLYTGDFLDQSLLFFIVGLFL